MYPDYRHSYEKHPNGKLTLKTGEPKLCDVPGCGAVATRFERGSKAIRNYGGPSIRTRPLKKACARHYSERVMKRISLDYPD